MTERPKVSVLMITFNHQAFINQAIESVLMQDTAFKFELVIGEDCSLDNTREIALEFANRYPDRVRLVLPKNNLGGQRNFSHTYEACRGEYIAICEGDDYWTDPHKLQMQVDFLETHPEYIICHHNARIIDETGEQISDSKLPPEAKIDFTPEQMISGAFILTLTACFRNVIQEFPPEFYQVMNGDTFLFSLLGNFGKSKYMAEIEPAAYRIHPNGVWSSLKDESYRQFNRMLTYFWLSRYYSRIRKNEPAYRCKVSSISNGNIYPIQEVESAENHLLNVMKHVEAYGPSLDSNFDDVKEIRSELMASVHLRQALLNFRWQRWNEGSANLQRAIDLDPDTWTDDDILYPILTGETSKILNFLNIDYPQDLHSYLNGMREAMCETDLPAKFVNRLIGDIYAEYSYRSYLAKEYHQGRRYIWNAFRHNPSLLKNKGMVRRLIAS